MSPRIRVLVVDDAVIVRRLMAQALAQEPDIEVVGTASDGDVAFERIEALCPDVVTLDLDMPYLGGLAVLPELRRRWPTLPVVIFTGMEQPGAAELEALRLGANDCLTKVPHQVNMLNAIDWVREELAPRLRRAVAARPAPRRVPQPVVEQSAAPPAPRVGPRPRARPGPPEVLAIGTSTGGPNALEELLRGLPHDFPLPIVIVQHMPEGFTRLLADRLTHNTAFQAAEGRNGVPLRPGEIWIAPGTRHLLVQRNDSGLFLQLNDGPPENSCRPAVDVLFRSLARSTGARTLAVVLTGMGQDGLEGGRLIVAAGGEVLAQDEASSVVWGMPGAVVRAGLASAVVPLSGMAEVVLQRARGGRALASPL